MRIRSKITFVLLCVFICLLGVSLAVERAVLDPSFRALEREEAAKDGNRCVQAIEREVEHLSNVGLEWSDWNDLYDYVVDRNEKFFEANLASKEYFRTADLPVMFIVGADRRIVWSGSLDLETLEDLPIGFFPRDEFPEDHPLFKTNDPDGHISGFILTPERGPMIVCSRLIRKTDSTGEPRGRFIIARDLADNLIPKLRSQTEVEFALWSSRDEAPEHTPPEVIAGTGDGLIVPAAVGNEKLSLYRRLACLTNEDSLILRADVPRDITRRGKAATGSALAILMLGGGAIAGVLMLALQWLVIRPLGALTRHAERVGVTGDLTARTTIRRDDEIGVLAGAFDQMTERLAQAQTSLADASRTAGMAEVASGVLHNVGNVLNSVVVSVHGVRQGVDASKVQGFLRVADLILEHKADLAGFFANDPRAKQIPDYLDKLAHAVRAEQGELSKDITRLSESVNHIVEIIASQQTMAKKSEVLEAVDVVEVARAAATVIRASCERHGVRVEFADANSIRTLVDRSRLQQIIVNLMTNAVQAVKQVAPGNRVIRLACGEEAESYWIEVRDNGVGFDPEVRSRLFQQGFTTRAEGHGVGLHYCAVTIKQLGGRIAAESEGPGLGAAFRITLPLQRDEARLAA